MNGRKPEGIIRVLVADDHVLVRDGISSLLALEADMEVVGVAENGEEAVLRAHELLPDVILMDIRMPRLNGIEATRQIKSQHPDIPILCMSVHHEEHIVNSIMDAGASGYLLKGNAGEELATAIRAVVAGEVYFCSTISAEQTPRSDD